MNKARFWSALGGLLAGGALILASCGPALTENVSPVGTPPSQATGGTGATVAVEAQEITNMVRQDLAERLKTAPDNVTVVDAQAVNWPDASLGCPQPGKMYAQVITPGYQIVLRVGGQEYTYHTGGSNFTLCENGEPILDESKSAPDELDPQQADLVDQAQEDLLKRLKTAPDSIVLQSIEPVEWPDSSLGCPQPGMNYLMVVTPGYLIKLETGGKIYEYHTDTSHVVYCENPKPPLPAEPGSEVDAEARLADLAKADLARQLNMSAEQIQVVKIEAVNWPDASQGCPQPGKMYAQVITPGYQIILSASGKEYDYHSNLRDVFLCKK
jgi:hypothetical protein